VDWYRTDWCRTDWCRMDLYVINLDYYEDCHRWILYPARGLNTLDSAAHNPHSVPVPANP
jgi:hypothetical protein